MTFLYLTSDRMGEGDAELGRKLMKSFLFNLSATDAGIDAIGCVNSGVLLTTEGSEVIDSLRKLEEKGARIVSCGTCLDHLGLNEKLLIGGVGTMEQAVQTLTSAEKVIRP